MYCALSYCLYLFYFVVYMLISLYEIKALNKQGVTGYPSHSTVCENQFWKYWYKLVYNKYNDKKLAWWRHQMETFSTLLVLCVGNSPVTGVFPTQRPVTRGFDAFFNGWVNNREAGDLRRHRAHYDVIVMARVAPSVSITYFIWKRLKFCGKKHVDTWYCLPNVRKIENTTPIQSWRLQQHYRSIPRCDTWKWIDGRQYGRSDFRGGGY